MARIRESAAELPNKTFYASWDDITTTRAWDRPSLANIIKWRDTLFDLHNDLEGIEVHLVGGYAELLYKPTNPLTWDADVCFIVDESVDYQHIKRVMDDSLRIGLEIGLLLDQKAITPYAYNFFKSLYSGVVPEYNDDECIYFKNFLHFDKKWDGVSVFPEERNWPDNIEITNVYPGLYKIVGINPFLIEKVINKFKKGTYTGRSINLKTTDFNFTT
jgi:hypothetical protein